MKLLMFLESVDCIKDCGGADVLRLIKFVWDLLGLVLFVVPIGLIIIIMIDFGKNVMANKEEDMKKNVSMVIKRIIYCVVLFLVPTIVNFCIGLVDEAGVSKAASCIEFAKEATKETLSQCEVSYENLGSNNGSAVFKCYRCRDKDAYAWIKGEPSSGYGYDSSKNKVFCDNFFLEPVEDDMCVVK